MEGNTQTTYWRYWGKARPQPEGAAQWHLLPYHALDVAAVGLGYLQSHPRLLRFFADGLGCSLEETERWLTFWLALHDLGKFTAAFQSQHANIVEELHGQHESIIGSYPINGLKHDSLGAMLWRRLLSHHDVLGSGGSKAMLLWERSLAWIEAVTGHHGEPPDTSRSDLVNHCLSADEQAAAAFVKAVLQLLGRDALLATLEKVGAKLKKEGTRLSWWLAGLAVLADWIGSNTLHFPYCDQPCDLSDYWRDARNRAEQALRKTGVLPQAAASTVSVQGLFGADNIPTLTPLQVWAESQPLATGPQLYLLEDVTGAGKTEAAITLAARLMSAGQADGLYLGLPTMATANAMYARVDDVAARLFDAEAKPNLILAHGQRHLVPGFAQLHSRAERDQRQHDDTASTRCAAWLGDHSKKALLAQLGVGTLDQAVLGILHARHQSLRLLGLFGKVLLVDEVHACDEYQRRLLATLLHFHAASGGSAILLSATLPQRHRQQLADAFRKGLGAKPVIMEETGYPLATGVSAADRVVEAVLDSRASVCRTVKLMALHDTDAVHQLIAAQLAQGRCVAWIRNTVADVLAAAEALQAHAPLIFHARCAMGDRLQVEEIIRTRFGKHSTAEQRRGQLVIASQVLEMSLDCDFDVLISDLAPVDRLIQRAGRLQRHARDPVGNRVDGSDARGGACLWVLQPEFTDAPQASWFSQCFPRGAQVYPHHGQLWLTARCLQGGSLTMPDDARRFIEAVYDEAEQDQIPEGLHPRRDKVEGDAAAARSFAANSALKFKEGYRRGDQAWESDELEPGAGLLDAWDLPASTRLGEASVMLRLAAWREDRWQPWCDEGEHAWDLSALRLPARLIAPPRGKDGVVPAPPGISASDWQTLRLSLPDEGKWSPVLALHPDAQGRWAGQALDAEGRLQGWVYDARLGLARD